MPTGETSQEIRQRVAQARTIQTKRFSGSHIYTNSRMSAKQIKEFCQLDKEAANILKSAIVHLKLSARAYDKILKVARTIADLEGSESIHAQHIAESTQFRSLDKKGGEF